MHEHSVSLIDRVDLALSENPHLNRRDLRLESNGGQVVLKGNVRSYYQKQMAQEAIKRIDGVVRIDNQLNVTWERPRTEAVVAG